MICPEDIASTPILANDAIFFTVIPPETSSVTFFRTLAFCSTLTAAAAPLGVKLSSNMAVAPHFAAISAERASSTSTWIFLYPFFLAEDVSRGDVTGSLLGVGKISAKIISREHATISGVSYAAKIFSIGGCRARTLVREGSTVNPGVAILTVSGQARHVLKCERTALNLVSRMSGIATMTKKMVSAMPAGGPAIYATRKTAPGLRFFDKEAVVAGGGRRHRMSLNSSIMIKDNHLDSGYSIDFLVQKARKKGYKKIQVEVEDARSALIAAKCGATAILLDNFTPKGAAAAVKVLQKARVRKNVTLEVSGGITVKNIASFAKIGVDAISSGQITSSAPAIDLSLEVCP